MAETGLKKKGERDCLAAHNGGGVWEGRPYLWNESVYLNSGTRKVGANIVEMFDDEMRRGFNPPVEVYIYALEGKFEAILESESYSNLENIFSREWCFCFLRNWSKIKKKKRKLDASRD